MTRRRTYLRSVATVATVAALAGCSGDSDGSGDGDDGAGDGGDGSGDPTPTATATPEATDGDGDGSDDGDGGGGAQSEYPDYNWDQLDGVDATEATTVEMTGFAYDPLVARVPAGEEITFPNSDSAPHTVTAPAADVDVEIAGGEEGTVTIDEPGTYDYVCRFHAPDMLGRLVVEE